MAVIDSGGSTAGKANVDANYNAQVRPPITKEQTGFVALTGPAVTGGGVTRMNAGMVTEGGQQAVAMTIFLWDDTFNATAQNTGKYRAPITTMTVTFVGGYAIINGGSITTINTNAALQTYRTFPIFAKSETRCNMSVVMTQAPQSNCVVEMGLFSAALPGAAAPTDGVFFRWNSAGELRGVVNYNGTETQTAAITSPSTSVNHDYIIVVQTNTVLFVIDDVLVGTITLLTDAPTLGQPMSAATQPFTIRQYIGGSAPSLANQFKISDVFITLRGGDTQKPWMHVKSGFGHHSYQGQNGGTMGTTAQYANSTTPGAAVPTNTTAALGSGLGGLFQETLTLASPNDGIIASFQNPAGSITQTPRTLYVTGIAIQGVVTVVLPATIVSKAWCAAFGHTAVSLATAEAATTKAARRVSLGCSGILASAAVGTLVAGPSVKFDTPLCIAPGEFFQVVNKNATAAPASGAVLWNITVDGYFE